MAAHEAWMLACRLFAGGTPVLRAALSPREVALLPVLGRAIKPAMADQRFVLCPHCQQHRAQVWGDGHSGRMCRCPDCGPVVVEASDGAAVMLDEDWLRQKLRLALEIESRDGVDALGEGVWRLGDTRRSPVLLARDLIRLWREPALLDRVRVAGGPIRIITPKPRETCGAPFGPGVEWLALEDRFAFYGGGISFIGATGEPPAPQAGDPTTPVHGPFSADFRWVTLSDGPGGPIRLTEAQAAVFKALWSFKGEPRRAEQIMQRAGLESDKPIDVFKVKPRDKGKPEAEGPLAAYRELVVTQKRAGLYSMPCASAR
jgi:ribosomal protein S27E